MVELEYCSINSGTYFTLQYYFVTIINKLLDSFVVIDNFADDYVYPLTVTLPGSGREIILLDDNGDVPTERLVLQKYWALEIRLANLPIARIPLLLTNYRDLRTFIFDTLQININIIDANYKLDSLSLDLEFLGYISFVIYFLSKLGLFGVLKRFINSMFGIYQKSSVNRKLRTIHNQVDDVLSEIDVVLDKLKTSVPTTLEEIRKEIMDKLTSLYAGSYR